MTTGGGASLRRETKDTVTRQSKRRLSLVRKGHKNEPKKKI